MPAGTIAEAFSTNWWLNSKQPIRNIGLLRFQRERMHVCRGTHNFRGAYRSRVAEIALVTREARNLLPFDDGFSYEYLKDRHFKTRICEIGVSTKLRIESFKSFSERILEFVCVERIFSCGSCFLKVLCRALLL
ncbi:hypothetical protein SUGI_0614540 [Cryptomeria japonica]|nr:hypothetical protein SUGI_0614540 [Cryptomeria japonica]